MSAFGQANRRYAFEFYCCFVRHLSSAARFKLEARFRRGTARRHWFYDVNFYYKSRIRRQYGNNQRFKNGDSAGFADRRNNRIFVA